MSMEPSPTVKQTTRPPRCLLSDPECKILLPWGGASVLGPCCQRKLRVLPRVPRWLSRFHGGVLPRAAQWDTQSSSSLPPPRTSEITNPLMVGTPWEPAPTNWVTWPVVSWPGDRQPSPHQNDSRRPRTPWAPGQEAGLRCEGWKAV